MLIHYSIVGKTAQPTTPLVQAILPTMLMEYLVVFDLDISLIDFQKMHQKAISKLDPFLDTLSKVVETRQSSVNEKQRNDSYV